MNKFEKQIEAQNLLNIASKIVPTEVGIRRLFSIKRDLMKTAERLVSVY